MALYHFTVKNNTKPSGKKISAVDHVKYINREGRFSDYDTKDDSLNENLIYTEDKKDILDGATHILYSSPYGNIYNTERGISITQNPSMETIATGLILAHEAMQAPLVIKGSESFKAKCIVSAVQSNLPISFADENMQNLLMKKKEDYINEREHASREGGLTYKRGRSVSKSGTQYSITKLSEAPSLEALPDVRTMPMGELVSSTNKQSSMFLQEHERDKLEDGRTFTDDNLRWGIRETGRRRIIRDFSADRRDRAKRTARAIIKNIDEIKNRTRAESHVEYINRQKAFEKRGGCVYTKCRLPSWATEWKEDENGNKEKVPSPNVFFRAADRYSPRGDRTYKEVEFALQNELTLEQNLEIVDRFIKENLKDRYYTYAVHDKIGTLSDARKNLHVHIMFSPRQIDDVELKKERLRSNYFEYPLRENAKDQSFENKWKHGAHKGRGWWDSGAGIGKIRGAFAQITNETLEKYGYSIRVDHRSLKVQEQEALMNGDTYLAELLHRIPEEHVSKKGMLEEKNPAVKRILDYRNQKAEHGDLMFEAELLKEAMNERERLEAFKSIDDEIHHIVDSEEFKNSDTDADSFIGELRKTFLEAYKDYQSIRNEIISAEDALEMARYEYMTDDEIEDYQELKLVNEEISHWKEFQDNLTRPETDDPGEQEAFEKLGPALTAKLEDLESKRDILQKKFDEVCAKLEKKSIKMAIQQNTHKMLYGQKHKQNILKQAEKNLKTTIITLSQALFDEVKSDEQKMYAYSDVYEDVRRAYYGYKKKVERLTKQVAEAKKKVISPERATKIAEDNFVGKAFSKLRASERALKKEESRYEKMEQELDRRETELRKSKDMPNFPVQEIRDQEKFIVTLRTDLQKLKETINTQKENINRERTELNARISTPEAVAKIQDITLGILRKNKPYAQRYEYLSKSLKEAQGIFSEKQRQMNLLSKLVKTDPEGKRRFRVDKEQMPSNFKKRDEPGIIASALDGNGYHMKVVTTSPEEDDKGLRSWKYLSEARREEEELKAYLKEVRI